MPESTVLTQPSKPSMPKKPFFSSLTSHKEVQFRADPNKVAHRKYYVSEDERRRLIREVNDAGLLLYEYYLMLAGTNSADEISDEVTAKYFGWEISKARRVRQNLTNHGWFAKRSYNYSGHEKGVTYYIGRRQVEGSISVKTGFTASP